MGTTWSLTIIALILMFVDKGVQPLSAESVKLNAHAAIGMTAFVLAFIQPFMAFFRPHPNTRRRPIFNFAHLGVGVSAILLAIVAIGLATKFDSLQGPIILNLFVVFDRFVKFGKNFAAGKITNQILYLKINSSAYFYGAN